MTTHEEEGKERAVKNESWHLLNISLVYIELLIAGVFGYFYISETLGFSLAGFWLFCWLALDTLWSYERFFCIDKLKKARP